MSFYKKYCFFAYIGLLPALLIYFFVRIYPIFDTLRLSFYNWDLISPIKKFLGFENYVELFKDSLFLEALKNTTVIALSTLLLSVPLGLLFCFLINYLKDSKLSPIYETIYFLPVVISLVPSAIAWKWIFDARLGTLNQLLGLFGIKPKAWLFDPILSIISIIILTTWQTLGYNMLIFNVGLKNVPKVYYEAATIDGANNSQKFFYITLPLIKPIVLYVSVVTLIRSFNIYAQVFVLAADTQGAPGRLVRVLVYDIIENAFRHYRMGYAATEAMIFLLIVMGLTLIQFYVMRERV
ncbi:sugar ABC transporter permease [Dictyoglomus thermophilum]|jgi:multiple sugar transport system permease protein|uniref:carbohydrate ABC transporter permease n=1 Tax=Dictyoglomus thermophilum TaxID=14 RepID=UPI0011EB112A|nr:sugar ABC transporter permease [Dictyoglomus thermophilum]TYT24047.1 sugar ABC transporter permease [Dictyoglomus thermophilum]